MGTYTKYHLDQMKRSMIVKKNEADNYEKSLENIRKDMEDLDRGIRALEALGDD